MVDSQYFLPNDVGISPLDCREAFQLLSPSEQLYAHYMSRASWYGGLVVLLQTSPESPAIYVLLQRLFRAQPPGELQSLATSLTEEEYQALLVYAAGVYANMGNYKSFGDTKFIPNLPKEKLKALVWQSQAFRDNPSEMEALWSSCGDLMYSLEERQKQLGLGDKGITTYFSGNCGLEDAELTQKFLDSKNLSAYNTRLFMKVEADGKRCYEVRLASAVKEAAAVDGEADNKCGSFEFEGATFRVLRGDYAPLMRKVAENLEKAAVCGSELAKENIYQKKFHMTLNSACILIRYFSRRIWLPVWAGAEPNEKGLRTAIHSNPSSCFFAPFTGNGKSAQSTPVTLASGALGLGDGFVQLCWLICCPWKALCLTPRPCVSDDDIRQTDGFKNVSLGNVLAVAYATEKEKITFLQEEDKDLYVAWKGPSFEVQVGLHELLGHGSGKLFVQDEKGNFNFDQQTVRNPESGELISSWYKGSETWDSKFSTIASSYEECRAECVGLYLCLNSHVLSIFGHEGTNADDLVYVNWLAMVRAGLLGLEFYTPESQSWRQVANFHLFLGMKCQAIQSGALCSLYTAPSQAHMQARFVILRVLLEAGEGLVTLRHTTGADGRPDAIVSLDRSKIRSVGQPAIGRFLCKLQVHKSTADVEGGRALYERYSAVTAAEPENFLKLRDTVLLRKETRKMFVQANTRVKGDAVELLEYEGSAAGLIRSFTERFHEDAEELERELLELSRADSPCWC
ncbi:DPP3 peptidase, partial [Polyodon spathula]|nr:DPP3 peptidase [Polyodon spathula]